MAAQSGPVSGIAERYANALFDLADERKALDEVAEDLRSLKRMLDDSADLRKLVRSPVVKSEDQARAIEAVADRAGLSQLTRNFIGVVAKNRRLFAIEGMIAGYLQILARRRGEITAEVTAAKPLSDAQMAALQDSLRQVVAGKVSVDLTVDPSLLGGLVVKVGSRLFDSSIRTKLQRMQQAIRGA
ncbi:F-type H+-transporting ATPase subunit delta [Constrictibacter sp. MBR-5]|uniref:F0F1 ATP synthase subunit delta n=1 Tax=Constrictibacter sp. MBR-5 TaxID=3156467 RepID=UPI00339B319F